MQLSIIIVNYKSARLLAHCIRSVLINTKNIDFEIIVVDNASGDNSRDIITQNFSSVHWIQMAYNAGFARANNEGIRQSQAPVVLLLNSDTVVTDNAIGNVFQKFSNSEYVA